MTRTDTKTTGTDTKTTAARATRATPPAHPRPCAGSRPGASGANARRRRGHPLRMSIDLFN
jgi:hypothetical protein